MKRISTLFVLGLLFTLLATSGCQKIEGPGGAATIQGKLYVREYDSAGNLIKEYDAADMDVYIIYGNDPDETYFHDDIKTSYDGTFKFRFLEPGNYRIFFYEDATYQELISNPNGPNQKAIIQEITITDKKEVVDLGTIEVYERF
mmetsp:Transcript_12301/g.14312  ORF Transcript_12301/g.14312 Transcript_12301/m.14312 type:complete len:145 (+) Transcript_12301:111-545(+)